MVEFNLLPDIKLQYIRARSLKRVIMAISILVAGLFLAIFVLLLLFVDVGQKVRLNHLTSSINTSSSQLSGNANLNKILTIQNQLQTLPTLRAQAPKASSLFGYMSQLTPSSATVSELNISFTANTISITGAADSLATVNQFVDTLKFTTYNDGAVTGRPAFNTVVLSSFNYTSTNSGAASSPAQFTINFNFDPTIFSSTDNITLVVPKLTTTRSIVDQPSDLFKSNQGN